MTLLTKKALAASLEKLLQQKALDKITVKDITDDCGVNRQTFYYHFHDIYELVEWIFQEGAAKFMEEHDDASEWKSNILRLMELLEKKKVLICNVYRSVNRHQAEIFLQDLVRPALKEIVAAFASGMELEQDDFDFTVNFFSFAFIGILIDWVSHGMDKDYNKNIDRFFLLIEASLESALKKFAKEEPAR